MIKIESIDSMPNFENKSENVMEDLDNKMVKNILLLNLHL